MQRKPRSTETDCLACELPTQERLNYFTGQFLTERDFKAEQHYLRGKQLQHNRYLHGWGAICGLKVTQHPDPACQSRILILEPGLALDGCGQEIVVREPVWIDLIESLIPELEDNNHNTNGNGGNSNGGEADPQHLLISLCYRECETEFVPALYSDCGSDETGYGANRIREGFEIALQLTDQLPQPSKREAVGVKLSWSTTINQDNASRLALDSDNNLLYVLNAADPGQIMVYSTNNHCLKRSIDIEARGVDLALSPNGDFLYIIRHITSSTSEDYFLQVLNVQDLDNPITVNDISLSSGTLEPQITVSIADGRVYTLDPNSMPKKVVIWEPDINEPNPASPQYGEVEIGDEPSDIAVSADGVWLFIAEAANVDNHIKTAKVATLASPAKQVIHTIAVPDTPRLLATSGDSSRLYVVTAAQNIRAFHIQEEPAPPFPEIGAGVNLGANEAIALATSPAGKWAYVLGKDSSNDGWILIVNGAKFETEADQAVSTPVAVMSDPQDLLLAPDGRRLYAAGKGVDPEPCGGVSVLDVDEAPCREILWESLENCPEYPEDRCVPIAVVRDYVEGNPITDDKIDNRIRPLVPSTNTLKELILCALETGTGLQGPEGMQGDPGQDGHGMGRMDKTGKTGKTGKD